MKRRLAIALACGLVAGWYAWHFAVLEAKPRDFTQVWYAARAILSGHDPYALVGPGRAFAWDCRLFYPLTAALVALPLAPFSAPMACALFMGIGTAAFAWALAANPPALLGLASASLLTAIQVAQWSPLLAASVVVPPLAVFLVAKPTIGAAFFVARPSWWAVGGALVFGALAFAVEPGWLGHWLAALSDRSGGLPRPSFVPILAPGGVFVLLGVTRWRRPEARLLVALACVPQSLFLYEALPLFLIPRTIREAAILVVASYGAALWILRYAGPTTYADFVQVSGQTITLAMYLPCVVMILLRPNEGPVPAWIESAIRYFPTGLRGSAGSAPSHSPATSDTTD